MLAANHITPVRVGGSRYLVRACRLMRRRGAWC
jgi:hypothetical protein